MNARVLDRTLIYGSAVVLAIWVLIPFYLIAVSAFTPQSNIADYPKPLLPTAVSVATMQLLLERPRRGRRDARVQPVGCVLPRRPSAGDAGSGRGGDLRFRDLVERGLRRIDPHGAHAHASSADPRVAFDVTAGPQARRRVLH